jgi:hypothetical protein
MRGATVTQLADILKRAAQDHRLGITAILEDAPIERVREHWPAHASRLELMRTWYAPGHVEEFLNDTGFVAQITTGLDIEPGDKLRVLIMWGSGAPPWEADTCVFSQVRIRWSDLAAELEAAGFGADEIEDYAEVGMVGANKSRAGDAARRNTRFVARPSREKPFWPAAREVAREWLIQNGCPEPGDGEQTALEQHVAQWLENRGHAASESAVRRHVKRCIDERHAELDEGPLGS